MDIVEQIKGAVAGHEDEIAQGIDKAGDAVDQATDGKFADQVDQAQGFLKDTLGKATEPTQ